MWKVKVEVVTAAIRITNTAKEISGNNTKQALNTLWKKRLYWEPHTIREGPQSVT
jgi:hypothetical protein